MTDFLLELRSEEIPARMQDRARDDLARLFVEEIAKAGLEAAEIVTYATPRRLALIAKGLPQETEAVSEERKGPRANAPEQALAGFLRSTGLTREQLTERDGVFFAVIEKPGRKTAEVLAEAIPAIVRAFPWPKSMRWGAASTTTESLRWVRPLQGIVALLGEDVVPCEVDGVVSGAATIGHRFHHSGPITIGSAADYAEKLRLCHVIVDQAERRAIIREGAAKAAADAGLVLVEDEGLVAENAGLTEWPVPLLGRFDPAFLDVPQEVIQLTARVNQKYFVCHSADGKLANAFVCTANIAASDGGLGVVAGNEKVLAARLSDARFFWEQDLKVRLEKQTEKLKDIVFHEKLGTLADKVERVAKLARWLVEEGIVNSSPARGGGSRVAADGGGAGRSLDPDTPLHRSAVPLPASGKELANLAERAARLAKADLVTGMVGEFPELQGVMGGYYARAQGESDAVADAVRDHYKPVGQGDEVPTAPVTVAVSLADKLDTLVGFFAVDLKPSGSKDPFALRRAALGIVNTMLANQLRGSLVDLVREALWILIEDQARSSIEFPDDVAWSTPMPLRPMSRQVWSGGEVVVVEPNADPETFLTIDDAAYPAYSRDFVEEKELQKVAFRGLIDVVGDTLLYFTDRLEEARRREGVRSDIIRAVIPKEHITIDVVASLVGDEPRSKGPGVERFRLRNWKSSTDPVEILARVKALQAFVGTEDGANLLAGYKRAANILKKEGWESPSPLQGRGPGRGGVGPDPPAPPLAARGPRSPGGGGPPPRRGGGGRGGPPPVGPDTPSPAIAALGTLSPEGEREKTLSYTPEPAEEALLSALDSAEPRAEAAVGREDFEGAMAALATLRAPIDAFFDKVTVNDTDEEKRTARLGMLARVRDAVHRVADFSRIETQ